MLQSLFNTCNSWWTSWEICNPNYTNNRSVAHLQGWSQSHGSEKFGCGSERKSQYWTFRTVKVKTTYCISFIVFLLRNDSSDLDQILYSNDEHHWADFWWKKNWEPDKTQWRNDHRKPTRNFPLLYEPALGMIKRWSIDDCWSNVQKIVHYFTQRWVKA